MNQGMWEYLETGKGRETNSPHRTPGGTQVNTAVGRGIGYSGGVQVELLAQFYGCQTSPFVGCWESTAIEHLHLCLLLVLQLPFLLSPFFL